MIDLTEEIIKNIYSLFYLGLSNRSIARKLNINHKTVSCYLKKQNLISNRKSAKPANYIDNKIIKCSKCLENKYEDNFLLCRKNHPYPYRLSYCNKCRSKQINDNYNSNPYKHLKNIFNRLKARCNHKNITFNLDWDYFKSIFDLQNKKCFYTDKIFPMKTGIGFLNECCTVDKVIPEKGYIKGNIVFAMKRYNSVKYDLNLKEIELYLPLWYNKLVNCSWLNLDEEKNL